MDPLWYKDAVIYELHVRSFFDANDDGIGDFEGVRSKLDYLQDLGIDTIWLLPFYESPLRDDGYDIADYRKILPVHGTLDEFQRFLNEAHERGLRVLTELVLNHTSDRNPWFQQARLPGSEKRDWYMWSDSPDRYRGVRIIFKDYEHSNWQWDSQAGAYYWHRFFSHQPDLNWANPEVERALHEVLFYWMDMGVDGVRLDAVPYLYAREGTTCENLPETIEAVRRLRRVVEERYGPGRVLLAEANQWPEDTLPYFGQGAGDGVQMAYNFPLMPRMFMALRREDRGPIVRMLGMTEGIPASAQWALFLRNHDELTLEMVTEEERDYMYHEYAADPTYRLNLGIRRRLAPLLGGERRRIELMTSLLVSLPGSPVVYYGDEIGMGDNPFLGDRNGVRTPMQWSADKNAGFSRAPYQRLFLPPIQEGPYSYHTVNVEALRADPHSLFHFTRRLLAVRNQHRRTFGRGRLELLDVPNRRILAFVREFEGEAILVAANLSRFAQPAELTLDRWEGRVPVELSSSAPFPRITNQPYPLTFSPHAFYWMVLREAQAIRLPTPELDEEPELPAVPRRLARIRLDGGLESLLVDTMAQGDARAELEAALVDFLPAQRWFGASEHPVRSARVLDAIRLTSPPSPIYLTTIGVRLDGGRDQRYLVPLALLTERDHAQSVLAEAPTSGVARINGNGASGLLVDAAALEDFWQALYTRWRDGWHGRSLRGDYRAVAERPDALPALEGVRRLAGGQSSSAAVVGDAISIKLYRRLEDGPNPEAQLLEALTRAEFRFAPALRGRFRFVRGADEVELGIAHDHLAGAEAAWPLYVEELHRFLDRCEGTPLPVDPPPGREQEGRALLGWLDGIAGEIMKLSRILGVRTAELHLNLARHFEPSPSQPGDMEALLERVGERLAQAKSQMAAREPGSRFPASQLQRQVSRLASLAGARGWQKIRIHGHFHLGQVVKREGEYYLLDFEGQPERPIAARRLTGQALRDVSGMLRSFDRGCRVALGEHQPEAPRQDVLAWVNVLLDWVEHVFLRAYLQTAGDAEFVPAKSHVDGLLLALLLDRTLEELGSELSHRPDRVAIPLAGLQRLAERPPRRTF